MKAKRLTIAAAIVVSLIVAVAAMTSSRMAKAAEPLVVDQMPATIPEQGITFMPGVADLTLMPAGAEAEASIRITADKAITIAPSPETALVPATLLANVTVGSTLPPPGESSKNYRVIENRLAWVVTYTLPEPINVRIGPYTEPGATPLPPIMKSHTHSVIDANTGEFLIGFFTD